MMGAKRGRPKLKATKKVRMTVILEKKHHTAFINQLRNRDLTASQFFRRMVMNLIEMPYQGGFDFFEKDTDKQLPGV